MGEKSRPGRMLDLGGITRLVFGIGDKPPAPALPRQRPPRARRLGRPASLFDGLYAFDFGTEHQPA